MKTFILNIILLLAIFQFAHAQSLQQDLSNEIDFVVAKDGSGDYTSIQLAINAVPNNSSTRTVIFVKKGIYNEKVTVPSSKKKVTLLGEDVQETVLTYLEPNGIGYAVLVVEADDFWLMNMTVENKQGYQYAGPQAVALKQDGCDRNIVYHTKLFSFQDTWFSNTKYRVYAKDCFVEGSVDFVFGNAVVVIDSCVIFMNRSSGAVVTAANTNGDDLNPPFNKYGYVIFNSKLFSMPGWNNIHFLGRPWRQKASVIYYKCDFGKYVDSRAWNVMSNNDPKDAFFYEFRNTGETAIERSDYLLPDNMAQAVSKTDFSAAASEPCFDSLFNPNVIPAKRGYYASGWNPEEDMLNDPDGVYNTLNKYMTKYMDTLGYNDATLSKLQYADQEINLEPGKQIYAVNVDDIDAEDCFYPVFKYPGAGYIATRAATIPGFGLVKTVAKDKITTAYYHIYFDKDGAFTNATAANITLDTVSLPGFDPNVFEYHYELNDYLTGRLDDGKTIRVRARDLVTGADVDYNKSRIKRTKDTLVITITAPDELTTNTYTIYVSSANAVKRNENSNEASIVFNVLQQNIECSIHLKESSEVIFKIYDISGVKVKEQVFSDQHVGQTKLIMPVSDLKHGVYLYKIETNKGVYAGKVLKTI